MATPRITLDERAAKIARVMDRMEIRLDANETVLFARQLEHIEQKLYAVQYPQGHAIELVPLKTDIHPGAASYTYRAIDIAGEARRVTNWGTDFPRIDLTGKEITHKLQNYGVSFGYDLQQLRASQFANFQLETNLNEGARTIVMRKLDHNLWFGDTEIGVRGLANSTLVSPTAVITGTWTGATAVQIRDDVQKLINAPSSASKGVEQTTAVVLPHSRYLILATKFFGAEAPGTTVLDMLKKANPGVSFHSSYQLELADAEGDGPRAIAYANDPTKLMGLVPVEFEVLPAVDQGGQFEVKVMGRFGGVATPYPGAIAYMDVI